MTMSRRRFLGAAATAMVLRRIDRSSLGGPDPSCTVLDLGDACALPESLAGYRAAMSVVLPPAPVLIVPAALAVPMRHIERCLRRGGTVILESGAIFADERAFAAHRGVLDRLLGIRIDAPVDLWPRATPYVHYRWPAPALVRDFSRAVPLSRRQGQVIATADGRGVSLRRSVGTGQLIFLGSPLGPALWAGDLEARRWLHSVLAG